MSRIIVLSNGYITYVDCDLPDHLMWIFSVKWYAHRSRCGVYARNRKYGFLHRVLAGTPKHLQTDHVNGNHLDNRSHNLQNVMSKTNMRRMWKNKKKQAA